MIGLLEFNVKVCTGFKIVVLQMFPKFCHLYSKSWSSKLCVKQCYKHSKERTKQSTCTLLHLFGYFITYSIQTTGINTLRYGFYLRQNSCGSEFSKRNEAQEVFHYIYSVLLFYLLLFSYLFVWIIKFQNYYAHT